MASHAAPAAAVVAICVLFTGWIPAWPLQRAEACMETAWRHGYLEQTSDLPSVTFASPRAGTCACCALCHQDTACASLSFNTDTQECRLHRIVASYSTLKVDGDSWKYFVMPGRSQHEEFCRHDSDCQVKGDFCRGRVCTDLNTVTCRTIYETFGVKRRFGEWAQMYGWIRNETLRLACWMSYAWPGYTRILKSTKGFAFTRANIGYYNANLTEPGAYSILDLAEDIRLSRTNPTYKMALTSNAISLVVKFNNIPRSEPVLSAAPRSSPVGRIITNRKDENLKSVAMPFWGTDGEKLISVRGMSMDGEKTLRSLAQVNGNVWRGRLDAAYLFIRE